MSGDGPSDEQIARWWRTLDEHQQRNGMCPICRTPRRCWERSDAFGNLVAYDQLHRPRRVGEAEYAARYATRYGLEPARL